MARLWEWGALSTNPFIDFTTTWIEPVIQHAVDVLHRIEPDLQFTFAYVAVIGTAYLFHSPFRAHSTAATDTYGRITKVFQTWSTVVFFCFHLGPQFFRSKRSQIALASDGDDLGPILYLPLFSAFNILFAFLHKMKRRWGLGLTYGGRLSVIGLNSLILAAVGTVHYAYCSTLYERSSNRVVRAFFYSLTPAPVGLYPFRCIAKLLFLSACFIAGDYQYKKWMSFDPSRGILWGELYELRKYGLDTTQSSENTDKGVERDWRECVAPPRVYAPATLAAANPAHLQTAYSESAVCSGAPSYHASNPVAASKAETAPGEIPAVLLRPRVLYHECPPDMNMELIESWFDVDDAALQRVCGVRTPATTAASRKGSPPPPTQQRGARGAEAESVGDATRPATTTAPTAVVPHAESFLTRLTSFRAPRFFVREVAEAKHPVNRPGMVPWWSTFVLFTAWQTVAGATLRFLAFDVRTIQGFTTPKVFHLHFDASLRRSMANAGRCSGRAAPAMLCSASSPAPAELTSASTAGNSAGASKSADALDSDSSEASSHDDAAANGTATATTATAAAARATPDVWFDWIADVGDGFNPTYAMARLLAQPALHLPLAQGKQVKHTRRTSMDAVLRRNAQRVASSAGRPTVKTAASAPTTPKRSACAATTPFLAPSAPFALGSRDGGAEADGTLIEASAAAAATTAASPLHAAQEEGRAGEPPSGGEGPGRVFGGSPDTPLPRMPTALRVSSFDAATKTRSLPGAKADGNDGEEHHHDASTRSREAVSASFALRAPRRHTTAHHRRQPKSAASRALLGVEKNGVATLPRGSFVVVGGDLAYPSPDDETYTTRLFEPYNDALGGNVRLQNLFHAEQQRIVVADRHDVDVAHLHMLDATTVSDIATGRGGLGAGRGSAEEALRSLPLLFAIPGNHDWFDGLTTYRKYILERTWIGGWLMPQRSSFFVLRLPYNWFMLCGDTGNTQDIDTTQRNYFLDVIERYMDAESCVILAAHEPGWLFDAMEREERPRQPELNRVVEALGTRLRLRLAGDIHNYSRHVPTDPSSEAATLIVSGGGGAFLHGARNDHVIAQGTHYVRACAFPSRTTFTNMAARLWGFRVVNWKFDMVVGFLCFVILLSVLPLPVETELRTAATGPVTSAQPVGLAQVFSLWVAYATKITSHVCTKGIISIFPILFFWMCFSTAGSDRHASLRWRVCYGAAWTFGVLLCCSAAMAFIHVQILYLIDNGFLSSSGGRWSSVIETQTKVIISTFTRHARQLLGGEQHGVARFLGSLQAFLASTKPMNWMLVLLRCLDPFETFGYLSTIASSGTMGVFADAVSRPQIFIYYVYVLFFYWIVITPVVSMLIGTFLLISVTSFDYMYDGTYSAFQIEDYKHFIRFRLDAATRQLHAYVIAVQKPAKVYEVNRRYLWSLTGQGLEEHRPPHLKQHPSRWAPMEREKRSKKAATEVLEYFTVHPHRVPQTV